MLHSVKNHLQRATFQCITRPETSRRKSRLKRHLKKALRLLSIPMISLSVASLTTESLNAQELSPADVNYSRQLVIAVPNAIPPYAIREFDRGIEIDIVRAALAHQGYGFSPEYVPLGRLNHTLTSGQVDGAMTVKEGLITADPIYFSHKPHIFYHNVAISLADRGFVIEELDQLQDYSIAVFQTPDQFIGPNWTAMREKNSNPVFELSNQKSQVKMLYAGRVDTLVMDINIFHHYRRQLASAPQAVIAVHDILPRNYVKVAFANPAITSAFDTGLAAIKTNGEYQRILTRYRDELQSQSAD